MTPTWKIALGCVLLSPLAFGIIFACIREIIQMTPEGRYGLLTLLIVGGLLIGGFWLIVLGVDELESKTKKRHKPGMK